VGHGIILQAEIYEIKFRFLMIGWVIEGENDVMSRDFASHKNEME